MKIKLLIPLMCFCMSLFASKVDTFYVYSESMQKDIPNLVILPDTYKKQDAMPVLYLLHGATGDFKDWLKKVPELAQYADDQQFIIICPDGASTSWYFDSPVDPSMRYETYVSQELVTYVDASYKTIASREGRAITGLSMGGHGAFYISFRHQDTFGAAGSTSGGLDIRPFPENWKLAKRLGDYADHKQNWEDNTVINQVYLLHNDNLKLIFDCGVDDFFYDANKRMHAKLLERNIPHDYTERPGGHTREYWANAIKYHMVFFNNYFYSTK